MMLCVDYLHQHPAHCRITSTELAELSAYHQLKLDAQKD